MSFIAARLAAEVDGRIAGIIWWWRGAILSLKALLTSPRFDQRPVHTEVLVREQVRGTRLSQHVCEKLLSDIAVQEPIAVLGEDRRHPHRFVHVETYEPPR